MRFKLFRIVVGILVATAAGSGVVNAQMAVPGASNWEAGKNYFVLDPPQPTSSGDKIEVVEVFSYGCPVCNQFLPFVNKLKKTLPANATLSYVPASFKPNEDWPLFQRAFYAAQALGIADQAHDAMFAAVWSGGPLAIMEPGATRLKQPLPGLDDVAKFYAQFGVKAEDFVATANSFAVNTQMKRADAYVKATQVDGTPSMIVNGKYRVTGQSAGGWDKVVDVVQYLVRKESAGK